MKILCLYNNECAIELFEWLRKQGHEVVCSSEELNVLWCRAQKFDLTVSYTYRYILRKDILQALKDNAVNIHNSYLPWNRGADPNIWSIVDGTPRGVTLHYMDAELDKGYIIAQKLAGEDTGDTLRSSYEKLDKAAKEVFKEAFAFYNHWPEMKKVPLGTGSYHSLKDGERIKRVIDTYDLKVTEFKERVVKSII
ncbi:formyltransferase family protein [Candidatus Merdisoma sp. JLR.KK011]|uniref:formyltransferase family protein n=1 Tax=Candidatus Merdisoma sp. JLR.KK011 TaxID=3114299 RepID=UPI002FF2D705